MNKQIKNELNEIIGIEGVSEEWKDRELYSQLEFEFNNKILNVIEGIDLTTDVTSYKISAIELSSMKFTIERTNNYNQVIELCKKALKNISNK